MKVTQAALRCPGTVTVQFLFGNRAFRHKVGWGSPLTRCLTAQLMLQQMRCVAPPHISTACRMQQQPSARRSPCLQHGSSCLDCCAASRLLGLPSTVLGSVVHFCSTSCQADPAAAPASCSWTVMPWSTAVSAAQHPAYHLQGEGSCLHCQLAPLCLGISAVAWALLANLMVQAFSCGGHLPACQPPASCSLPGRMARALLSRQCRPSSPPLLRWLWRGPAWLCGLLGWLWRKLVWRPPFWVMAVHAAGLGEPCVCLCTLKVETHAAGSSRPSPWLRTSCACCCELPAACLPCRHTCFCAVCCLLTCMFLLQRLTPTTFRHAALAVDMLHTACCCHCQCRLQPVVAVCCPPPSLLKQRGHAFCRAPLGLPGLVAVSLDLPGGLEGPGHASVADQCLEAPRASSAAHQAVRGLHPGQHRLDSNVPGWHLQLG